MKTKLVVNAFALITILGTLPASAGVIYRWQDITTNPIIGAFSGEIEFSYDLWSPGGQISESGGTSGNLDPIFGIEHFYWSNPSGIGYAEPIESTKRPCSAFVHQGLDYDCAALGLPDDKLVLFPLTGGGPISANFQLTFGAVLEGTLSFNDSSTDVRMHGAGPLWTIDHTGSDGKTGICFRNDGSCWGSTGLWVLDLSTLPPRRVTEPSSLALLLLAIGTLAIHRRLRRS